MALANVKTLNGVDNTGGGAVGPDDIANLILWIDADQEAYGDGDPVNTMNDFSGAGNDFAEATNPPSFQTAEVNGQPVFQFDGTNDQVSRAQFDTDATAVEGFMVIKCNADPSVASQTPWDFGSSGFQTYYTVITSGDVFEHFGNDTWRSVGNPTPSLASWRLYNVWSAANDYNVNLDGSSIFSSGTNTVTFSTGAATFWFGTVGVVVVHTSPVRSRKCAFTSAS